MDKIEGVGVAALWAEHSVIRSGGESAVLGDRTSAAIRETHLKLTGRGEAVMGSCPSSSPARDSQQPSLVPTWKVGVDIGQGGVEEEGVVLGGARESYDFRPAREAREAKLAEIKWDKREEDA
jgi:hypothetical protein